MNSRIQESSTQDENHCQVSRTEWENSHEWDKIKMNLYQIDEIKKVCRKKLLLMTHLWNVVSWAWMSASRTGLFVLMCLPVAAGWTLSVQKHLNCSYPTKCLKPQRRIFHILEDNGQKYTYMFYGQKRMGYSEAPESIWAFISLT